MDAQRMFGWIWLAATAWAGCTAPNPLYQPGELGAGTGDLGAGAEDGLGRAPGPDLRRVPPDLSSPVTLTAACRALAEATCAQRSRCAPFLFSLDFPDVATCAARAQLRCADGFALPGATLQPAGLLRCAADSAALGCDDFLDGATPASCRFTGELAVRSACGDDAQCASGYCDRPDGATCGRCDTRAGAGQSCAGRACQPGLICNLGTCVTPRPENAACDFIRPCLPTLVCRGGLCEAPLLNGEACDPNEFGCDALRGQHCDALRGTCADNSTARPGESCDALTNCLASSVCRGITCVPPAADGAACFTAPAYAGCMPPASCKGSLCQVFDPAACK